MLLKKVLIWKINASTIMVLLHKVNDGLKIKGKEMHREHTHVGTPKGTWVIPYQINKKKSGPLSIFMKFGTNMDTIKKLSQTKI